jgi:predicted dehydrogenase
VDVIYVSTPHPMHRDNAVLCLEAGKAVLCEKPLTVNAAEAEELIACARRSGVFLMEAMWTRFLPAVVRLRELLAEGALGEVQMVKADFCFRMGGTPEERWRKRPDSAGGALLDLGVYTLALASMVFGGPPQQTASVGCIGETGVDEQDAMVLRYGGGRLAVLSCGIRAAMPHEALVVGTERWARLHAPFWSSQGLTLGKVADEEEVIELPFRENGYEFEAEHVMECLRAGRTESEVMPLAESLATLRVMDALRAEWGLRYPME